VNDHADIKCAAKPFWEPQVLCSSCNFSSCSNCATAHGTSIECRSCGVPNNTPWTASHTLLAPEVVRGSQRPLISCTSCDRIQPQALGFCICDGCAARGERAVFCCSCASAGKHEEHMDDCRDRHPGSSLRRIIVVPEHRRKKANEFECDACCIGESAS